MKIIFKNNNQIITTDEETSLLRASIRYKVGMPYKCGGGICGTCVCKIEDGINNTNKLTKKELKLLSEEDIKSSKRLACQTIVNGNISVSWKT
ncbi:2Fe-2S iron-sulfur cluster binding domain-containing protein [Alphaproteobacteria bacterium]|jgi:ferredoxin|nr:2Fe-2S iron-sulfur cluster binding domain-containing protein [Alphaproteobacteria bacterium]